MNAAELIENIALEVMDDTLTTDRILPLLNRAQLAITQRINFPNLVTSDVVDTVPDTAETSLPNDFQKYLFKAYIESDGREVDVFNSRHSLYSYFGDGRKVGSGSVYGVTVEGRNLVYALIPKEAISIRLHYYRKPDALEDSENSYPVLMDDPDLDDALMYWVKWKFYEFIEQGLEGNKPDTQYNQNQYNIALRKLKIAIKEGESLPEPPSVTPAW